MKPFQAPTKSFLPGPSARMTWDLSSNMKRRALTIVNDNLLLPAMHSRLGGGMAWGDADGDGLEEIFTSPGQRRAGGRPLPANGSRCSFTKDTSNQVVFNSHRRHEDMGRLVVGFRRGWRPPVY